MLVLLPLAVLILLVLVLQGNPTAGEAPTDVRASIVKAAVIWGALVSALTEGLGALQVLTPGAATAGWGLAAVSIGLYGWRSGRIGSGLVDLRRQSRALWEHGRLGVLVLVPVVTLLAVIAFVSPPNNNDSLNYHMARVAHWAQDSSLRHYPTAFQPQLWSPVWAESAVLHTYLLAGGDRLANLVQFMSMLGSLIAASLLARDLGGRPAAQWFAALFVVSLPMGILQSTSTQNDYVAGFWLLCLANWTVKAMSAGLVRREFVFLGLTLGLGLATKGTFYIYAIPSVAVSTWLIFKQHGLRRGAQFGLLVGLLAIAPNLGFWYRNYQTYGQPLGPSQWLSDRAAQASSPGEMLANTLRYASLNWGTPFESVNGRLAEGVIRLCELLHAQPCREFGEDGIHVYRIPLLSNHEDSAGNPVHFVILGLAVLGLISRRSLRGNRAVATYLGLSVLTYLLFTWLVTWEIFGARYQLPLLLLPAAGIALVAQQFLGDRHIRSFAFALVLISTPWLLFNRTRPIVGWQPRVTLVDSIFVESRTDLLFANREALRPSYAAATDALRASGCSRVGLNVDSHDPEYLFWALLQDVPDRHIEVVNYDPLLTGYAAPGFSPCAVLCTICDPASLRFGALRQVWADEQVQLYLDAVIIGSQPGAPLEAGGA